MGSDFVESHVNNEVMACNMHILTTYGSQTIRNHGTSECDREKREGLGKQWIGLKR